VTASSEVVALLRERNLRVAVAESLTGGSLVAELIDTPGASDVVLGGIVAYHTELKHSLLGVDASVLNVHGAVHPDVAIQMAVLVRDVLAVEGLPAEVGISTTGVAGPDPQDGHDPGTAYLAVAIGADVRVRELSLQGDRNVIRRQVVDAAIAELSARLRDL
jgi:nicotinamide-nucleotide amidase